MTHNASFPGNPHPGANQPHPGAAQPHLGANQPLPAAAQPHNPGVPPQHPGATQLAASLHGVTKRYGAAGGPGVIALDQVHLDIPAGEFTAIMGPSGSGKSTLMHCMAGLDTPTEGAVLLGERDITRLGDNELTELRRREIGFIFQAFNLIPTLTARENIELPFKLDGRTPNPDEQAWIGQLVQTLGLAERIDHRPHEMSGGQQQRVAIARALGTRPRLVIADEPTGNLDSRSSAEVLRLLRDASRRVGQTIVMVTHDPVAAANADRIVFLADGRISREERGLSAQQISEIMLAGTASANDSNPMGAHA